jgi:hypothetical protein
MPDRDIKTPLSDFVKDKTVSIVASAASIKGNGIPEEIDSREVVIRLSANHKIPDEYRKYSGSKTTLLYWGWKDYDEIFMKRKHNPYYWINDHSDDDVKVLEFDGSPIIPKSKTIENEMMARWNTITENCRWGPSTGLMCIYDACLSGAKEIYLSGFDFMRSFNTPTGHEGRLTRDGVSNTYHDFSKEEKILKELIDEGYPIIPDKVLKDIIYG